jgi:uncharacterized protein YkwD
MSKPLDNDISRGWPHCSIERSSVMTFRIVAAVALLGLVLASGGPVVAQDLATDYCADEAEARMFELINEFRHENDLEPLQLSAPLGVAAVEKATEMAEEDYLAHESPDGRDLEALLEDVGYTFNTPIGENIAAGEEDPGPTFEQWRDSPEHSEIMLDEAFTAVGIGRVQNIEAEYDWYWAAEFGGEIGEPAEPCQATPEAESEENNELPSRLDCEVVAQEGNRIELSCQPA